MAMLIGFVQSALAVDYLYGVDKDQLSMRIWDLRYEPREVRISSIGELDSLAEVDFKSPFYDMRKALVYDIKMRSLDYSEFDKIYEYSQRSREYAIRLADKSLYYSAWFYAVENDFFGGDVIRASSQG